MPRPREIFENPAAHEAFLRCNDDGGIEGQYFERKQVGRRPELGAITQNELREIRKEIQSTVSAFANSNREGGLLVLGIAQSGLVEGIGHLSDEQKRTLHALGDLLVNQAAEFKSWNCADDSDPASEVVLIHVPCAEHSICETPESSPKAWLRHGGQNVIMTEVQREQIKRDKRIVDFETSICCPFDPADIDQDVLTEFRASLTSEATYDKSDLDLLYHVGALRKDKGDFVLTNVGALFFASNPQRVLPASFVRLSRFGVSIEGLSDRGLPTFDKQFSGPVTKQIRDVRSFLQQSGFFKTYQYRSPQGGFVEESEFPYIAVDEAIVNAVAHRDYAAAVPIECYLYQDAFVVENSGRILQRDADLRGDFSLEDTVLTSTPRNPMLVEWLKTIRDRDKTAFVRALNEGTRRMREEMVNAGLPPPHYYVSDALTRVTLLSLAAEREARIHASAVVSAGEFANLYKLIPVEGSEGVGISQLLDARRSEFTSALRDSLEVQDWYVDYAKHNRLVSHRRGRDFKIPPQVAELVRFYPAYSFQLRQYWGEPYLCVDYSLEVKSMQRVGALLAEIEPGELVGKRAVARWRGEWLECRILTVDDEWVRVFLFGYGREENVAPNQVIPSLSLETIQLLINRRGLDFDVYRASKQSSLSLDPNAARIRAERTQATVSDLSHTVFPLSFDGAVIGLSTEPAPLIRQPQADHKLLVRTLPEPPVEFARRHESADIREGVTRFGSYDDAQRRVELVPICTTDQRENMVELIERLKVGKYRFRGAERTFSTRFQYGTIVTVPNPELAFQECDRLLGENPGWIGNTDLNRIFLVHTPESGYASDDEQSPYFRIKRFLLERGMPCQMIDTPTLVNPDWKDLTLAMNMVTKCGGVPWVLPDAIPDADFFVGLSYTQNKRRGPERLMGFANVFNEFGRWMFYSGNSQTFPFDERIDYLAALVQKTLEQLTLSETPSIHFHYSRRFSRDERDAILQSARTVRPNGTYSFVWINAHHNVRLYDGRAESDGSLSRGSYVTGSPNQIYVSTTGYNPYRKALGTPEMLEVNVHIARPIGAPDTHPDLKSLAAQILSLTKLNWKSTESICGEPITIKYAGDIAELTAAFLRQGRQFELHPVLERTPWFI